MSFQGNDIEAMLVRALAPITAQLNEQSKQLNALTKFKEDAERQQKRQRTSMDPPSAPQDGAVGSGSMESKVCGVPEGRTHETHHSVEFPIHKGSFVEIPKTPSTASIDESSLSRRLVASKQQAIVVQICSRSWRVAILDSCGSDASMYSISKGRTITPWPSPEIAHKETLRTWLKAYENRQASKLERAKKQTGRRHKLMLTPTVGEVKGKRKMIIDLTVMDFT